MNDAYTEGGISVDQEIYVVPAHSANYEVSLVSVELTVSTTIGFNLEVDTMHATDRRQYSVPVVCGH